MTEQQKKKTLGIAIASLIFGCLVLIPLLGILFSIIALVLGIVAAIKISKNKDTLKGQGLAISGIVLGGVGIILIPIIALLAAIAIPNFLRARVSANDAIAQANVKIMASAIESYAAVNDGVYPSNLDELIYTNPPYLPEKFTNQRIQGYNYNVTLEAYNYSITVKPDDCLTTGTKIFIVNKDGIIQERDCQ